MRFLSRLAVVVTLCLMVIALFPVPAQAVCRFPEISLSSDRGVPGDTVTISGVDFDPDGYVDIYYYLDSTSRMPLKEDVLPDHYRRFSVTVPMPPSSSGNHRVLAIGVADGHVVERDATFRVQPGLTVTPTTGSEGTDVTVKGLGFAANEAGIEVRFYSNGTYEKVAGSIQADEDGSWEAAFSVPSSTGGEYRILARGANTAFVEAVRPAIFTVKPVLTMDEPSGGVGQSIRISGSGFAANEKNIRILLAGEPVAAGISADETGRWEASFVVPDMAEGEYGLTAAGDITRERDAGEISFEVRPGLMLSPDHGYVGMNLTATGRGFPAGKKVVILYNGSQVAAATTDPEGRFDVSFAVPAGRHEEPQVAVAIDEGTNSIADLEISATAFFMVESDPPATPEPLSPADGNRVGFVAKVRPTFEWSAISDPSGVRYSIQISTSPDFDPSSVLLSLTGLTGTSYTLASDPLPYGTYYWIVQAIDGAENESSWSEVQSFGAGRLPLWAFIVIIVFVAVMLLARLRVLLIRRLYYY